MLNIDDKRAQAPRPVTDLIAYGRPFIGNPDLVRRLSEDAGLNELRTDTLYGGDVEGDIDYPTLDEVR